MLDVFSSGQFDVIHDAGHGFFHLSHPGESGLLCTRTILLTSSQLASVSILPQLVFLNACESGRIRSGKVRKMVPGKYRTRELMDQGIGAAEAFMHGGVASFIGAYWPVSDSPATEFASFFYSHLLEGKTQGESVLAAKKIV